MYISGAIIAFTLAFITYMIYGIKTKQETEKSITKVFYETLLSSIMVAFLSWLGVIVILLLILMFIREARENH